MKFSINKNIILEQLINVSKAISTRNIIPILNGIKFELNQNGLYLTASDTDLTIQSFIEKDKIEKVDVEGTIIISSKYIIDIIKKMPADIINFEVIDELKIIIYTESSKYNLNCLNSIDYPEIELKENNIYFDIEDKLLKKMIKQTIFAVSLQESRPLLTGLNIKINGNILECIATDSYRLSKKIINLENSFNNSIDIVIPGKNINELDRILLDNGENVRAFIFDNKIMFKYKNIIFQSNLLNGNYPNTSNFIPLEFAFVNTAKLNDFYSSIDRASLLTQSKEKNVVKMKIEEDDLCISSYSSEIGKVEDHIKVKRNTSDSISISFSAKFMMDALKTFEDEEIIIFMNSDSKPIIIKSPNDETLTQLILPIKTY